ncbi:hypothetical protein I6N91_12740 [Arthrobacter sp. MSA 4-2]|uniref:hypothetical protein n=1 Tax=Arthrobacter sp. MSA 4-2 TaxID=2794349 RepID=UPI0018E786E6|nr:hypothetical protein [Arthrobacter sp. MSA 4-2]MBJ2121845.1 hypothetical protein [Arthrobacter sp. MSA 4-2]
MTPPNGLPHALRRSRTASLGLAQLAVLAAVVTGGPPVLGSLPPAAAASIPAQNQEQGREVKVAIVRAPGQNGGAPDSLGQVAERTLGDPGRAQEIFDLNAGRRQSDGSALTDPAALEAGWILILPDDAQGPDVRSALLDEPADAANGSGGEADPGNASNQPGGEAEQAAGDAADDGASNALVDRLRWPIVLAVLGGLGVAVLTTAIVLRRRIRLRLRRLRALIRAARAWVVAGWRRRASLRRRSELVALWQEDAAAGAAAAAAFRSSTSLPPAVAVSVRAGGAEVLGHPGDSPEDPLPGHPGTRPLPAAAGPGSPAVARVGGDPAEQVFLDFARCRGALGIEGDPALALDIARSVVTQLSLAAPQLVLLSLGPSELPRSASVATVEDLDRFGLLPPPVPSPRQAGLITSTSILQQLTGVLLIQPGRSQQELDDVVARCSAPGSGWIAVYPGSLRGAHWRWTVSRDGMLTVPILGRTLTATGL